jgi:DNA-binding NtrC family response regulator
VDDEPLVRWALSCGLRSAGFDAVVASSGSEAVQMASSRPEPRAALLDLSLHGTDLPLLIEEIRRIAPRCRIIGLATAGHDLPAPPLDDIDIIEKPFDLLEVVRVVEATVAV